MLVKSIFDGVEYALKGEVSYLKNTEKYLNLNKQFIIIEKKHTKKHTQVFSWIMVKKHIEKFILLKKMGQIQMWLLHPEKKLKILLG